MRFRHTLFEPLHFDFGTTLWSINHMPLFGAILSVVDHRKLGTMHSVTFLAMVRILTNGQCKRKQAQAMFDHLDLSMKGDLSYPELGFFAGMIVAQKDQLEREFVYMNTWKLWVMFNEFGHDVMSTREFRRSGLFFDFDYPTMYDIFRDYSWIEANGLGFERFRFFLISCVHSREIKRYHSKYIRYRQFRNAVLLVLQRMLRRVLTDGVYPSPRSILKAIRTIKITPIEGVERTKRWTDIFDFSIIHHYVVLQWERVKLYFIKKVQSNRGLHWCCKWLFCNCYFCAHECQLCTACDDSFVKGAVYICQKCKGCRPKCCKYEEVPIEDVEVDTRLVHEKLEMGLYVTESELLDEVAQEGLEKEDEAEMTTEAKRLYKIKRAKVKQIDKETAPEIKWRPLGPPKFICQIL